MKNGFRLAICQLKTVKDKLKNIDRALEMLDKASKDHIDIAILPEMFNCPYDNSKFFEYSEQYVLEGNVKKEGQETISAISEAAHNMGIYIVAGSIPEFEDDKVYNTSFIFDRKGELIGKHRKVHLFDIDVPGKIKFRESDTLTPGNDITIIPTEFCKIGVAICYDMRFPEQMRIMALEGAKLIIVPAAFNMVTGPLHWEPLIRVRAMDNQVYMAAASPARNELSSYKAFGHSMVVDPWGGIVAKTDEREDIIYADINLEEVDRVREELPLLKHRRTDIYDIFKR